MSTCVSTDTRKQPYTLTDDAIKTIERILRSKNNARVTTGKNGVTVYEEKVTTKYPQS